MKSFFRNIQSLRGIAVLSVMFFHLTGIQIKHSPDFALPGLLQFGAVGVDIFFLISGFLMMVVTRSFLPGTKSMYRFVLHRSIRIYPMYWLVSAPILAMVLINSAPILIAMHVNPDMLKSIPDTPYYLLQSLLLIPQKNLPLLTISWTLIHEMYFYCVFGILLLLPARLHIPVLVFWSALTQVFWQYLQPNQSQPWSYLLCNPLTLEFTTGCFVAAALQRWQVSRPTFVLAMGVITAFVSWYLWTANNSYEFPIAGDRVTYFLLPCTLILVGTASLELQGHIFYPLLQKIGDASYSIYLTHILFLSIGRKIWQAYADAASLIDNLIWWPTLFAVTLAGGMLCYYWIEKPLLGWLRDLTRTSDKTA
ncbi:MAG TPA: acyltransferase [Pseudomonadales bacterium]|nr:acyltransferase [Pseudomonadales bacterium]